VNNDFDLRFLTSW